ncbi:MAG: helix-turn-helix transcriptional regulator [Phascolarctobacterium sp.]|nr:helix-turn-helix transcriptional regulator [Acidaminococcaceae bacterium]MBQ7883317.1 helix-turn-helix transcriptional regulator [Phascolarctobacterium sp.]MBQ8417471.1 helix-turn-helix transcriptional regulator [Phascolarctobacterium sp.]
MNKDFRESLNEQLKDPEFKKEYEALEPEFQIIRAMLEARDKLNLTQKDLAELSGITQADISRLENGNANPSIRTLKKLALAMNMTLDIKFVPLVKI